MSDIQVGDTVSWVTGDSQFRRVGKVVRLVDNFTAEVEVNLLWGVETLQIPIEDLRFESRP